MRILSFYFIMFVVSVGSTLRTTLESISPDGTLWFIRWGEEQKIIETVHRIVDGDTTVSWADVGVEHPVSSPIISYAILSRNPEMSLMEFRHHMSINCARIGLPHTTQSIDNIYVAATSYLRIPLSLHIELKNLKKAGKSAFEAVSPIVSNISENLNLLRSLTNASTNTARNRMELRVRTKFTFWYLFCLGEHEPFLQIRGDEIEANLEAKHAIIEHMLLVVLKQRTPNGRQI
jgi:hypothetical protein